MVASLQSKIIVIWVGLMVATGLSWQFGHGFGFGDQFHYGTAVILIITFVKIRFVFLDFMELRTAPRPLRMAFEVWAISLCGTLIGLYWLGV